MKARKVPMRMCIGCQESKPKRELIRIVRDADGILSVDRTGKKNGRGAYICPNPVCLEKAYKARRLEKAFEVSVGDDLFGALKDCIASDSGNNGGETHGE